jgi:hypothetical protein
MRGQDPVWEDAQEGNLQKYRVSIGWRRTAAAVGSLMIAIAWLQPPSAQANSPAVVPLLERNIGVSREEATRRPRNENDQAIVEGWPLYRTERGQAAFNDTMATLKATEGPAPAASAFRRCAALACHLALPAIGEDGWIPAGRLWVSPSEYVLIVRSPRLAGRRSFRRHGTRGMSYFVFHEFHNSSRNTDAYDTISSHSGYVFVPFYMTRQATDAWGRRFVTVLQVAPYDVVSVHATNLGSAGPGIEVANNSGDDLDPLQLQAGILVAAIVKKAAPRLEVVNHRGSEGLELLEAWQARLSRLRGRPMAGAVTLPFVPARAERVAAATGDLDSLITRRGMRPRYLAEPKLVGPIRLARRPARKPD